jgi:ATP-dependent protease ClpP protease subunit
MKNNAAKPVLPAPETHSSFKGAPQARKNTPPAAITTTGTEAELLIYDDIGEFFGMGISAAGVIDEINSIDSGIKSLTVRLNSPGGDVFDGAAIYNALARLRIPVNVHVDGVAASITSIIAMSGDTITMAANSLMMIHRPWRMSAGDADELRKDANVLDQVQEGMTRIYTARTGQPEAKINDLMAEETWMTADEALALGFSDATTDPVGVAARADLSKYPFKHVPKAWAEPPKQRPDYAARIAALAERRAAI